MFSNEIHSSALKYILPSVLDDKQHLYIVIYTVNSVLVSNISAKNLKYRL